jgi:mannose-6-phosphate isomerase
MTELYPLKFEPTLKEKVWGSNRLAANFGKNANGNPKIGESWEISGLPGDESIIANGFLAGNNINELLEVYMGDIAGESVYEKYGDEFPLLIKFIDAASNLSVQVHPGDEMARKLHHAYGKSEMWYVLSAEEGSLIYCGFRKGISTDDYLRAVQDGNLPGILNAVPARAGDAYWIPAGTIHAIGSGVVLAEIQQASDITYRIYDWDRGNSNETRRELHTDLAMDALLFNNQGGRIEQPEIAVNNTVPLVKTDYFHANILTFDTFIRKDYNLLDSFVIFICTSGQAVLHYDGGTEKITMGETILLPAGLRDIILEPQPACSLLEVFIKVKETN